MADKTMTLGELRQRFLNQLKAMPDDTDILFGPADSPLTLYQWKVQQTRADGKTPQLVQIQFNEIYKITG